MRVAAIGCGNVGLNTLRAFSERGHDVLGYDVSADARNRIADVLGAKSVAKEIAAVSDTDVAFIAVPTDPDPHTGAVDLSILERVVRQLRSLERDSAGGRLRLVVQRSTCPPGTAARLAQEFRRTKYAVNPSFLHKASAWRDSVAPERICFAGCNEARRLLHELYAGFDAPILEMERYEPVELLKYIENGIDAVLISLWNEFLAIADQCGVSREDFITLIDALPQRRRFATTVRVPGQAFGLWCLPKDLAALIRAFPGQLEVLSAAEQTNGIVGARHGVNEIPGRKLLRVDSQGVWLTDLARRYLSDIRKPSKGTRWRTRQAKTELTKGENP